MTRGELHFLRSETFAKFNPVMQILIRSLMADGAKAYITILDIDKRMSVFDDVVAESVRVRERTA